MTRAEARFVPGPAGRLDSRWHGPPDGTPVLLLHPHPAHGGSMGSRLIYDLALGLAEAGFRVVRFDYRDVGRSDGEYGQGDGETEDAVAVWDALREETGRPPAVVGHSFGGGVAVRLAGRRPAPVLVLAGAPERIRDSTLRPAEEATQVPAPPDGPRVHLVVGTRDPFLTPDGVERLAAAFPGRARIHALQDAGHFLDPDHNPRALAAVLGALGRGEADAEGE
jgi:uncharacterized protein